MQEPREHQHDDDYLQGRAPDDVQVGGQRPNFCSVVALEVLDLARPHVGQGGRTHPQSLVVHEPYHAGLNVHPDAEEDVEVRVDAQRLGHRAREHRERQPRPARPPPAGLLVLQEQLQEERPGQHQQIVDELQGPGGEEAPTVLRHQGPGQFRRQRLPGTPRLRPPVRREEVPRDAVRAVPLRGVPQVIGLQGPPEALPQERPDVGERAPGEGAGLLLGAPARARRLPQARRGAARAARLLQALQLHEAPPRAAAGPPEPPAPARAPPAPARAPAPAPRPGGV